jgi:hypothetical protein
LLLAVFAVTFVPFNLLHHHAEDEHVAALLSIDKDETHHCALDDYFCRPDIEKDCGHTSHIQETITKCFSCAFHFIKHFEGQSQLPVFEAHTPKIKYPVWVAEQLCNVILPINNKGPPRLV